jgi:hypothetical protein
VGKERVAAMFAARRAMAGGKVQPWVQEVLEYAEMFM